MESGLFPILSKKVRSIYENAVMATSFSLTYGEKQKGRPGHRCVWSWKKKADQGCSLHIKRQIHPGKIFFLAAGRFLKTGRCPAFQCFHGSPAVLALAERRSSSRWIPPQRGVLSAEMLDQKDSTDPGSRFRRAAAAYFSPDISGSLDEIMSAFPKIRYKIKYGITRA